MAARQFDALIVGGGPAGATLAILLARAGWAVAVVEQQRFPRRKVCGECLAAGNLPLLDALGVGEEFATAAGPELRRVALMQGGRCVEAALPAAAHPHHRWGRALGREALDTLLLARARAAGAEVWQPWQVRAIEGGPGGYVCRLRRLEGGEGAGGCASFGPLTPAPLPVSGERGGCSPCGARGDGDLDPDAAAPSLHAALLIAACGSWGRLPAGLDGHWQRAAGPNRLLAFKAQYVDADLAPGLLPVLALPGGYGGMVLADGGRLTLACCVRADRLARLRRDAPGADAGEAVEAWLRASCTGVACALRGARRDGSWLGAGPLAPGLRLHAGEAVFRVGNAAAEAHPIIGEGLSMALQSAWLLGSVLTADAAPAAQRAQAGWQRVAQERYLAAWRRQFLPRLRFAAAAAALATRPWAASLLGPMLVRRPGLLTIGAHCAGKARAAPMRG